MEQSADVIALIKSIPRHDRTPSKFTAETFLSGHGWYIKAYMYVVIVRYWKEKIIRRGYTDKCRTSTNSKRGNKDDTPGAKGGERNDIGGIV